MKNWVNIKKPEMKKARIEIIPMIDTIFFLLVFFMFTSLSMVQMKGLGVSLPKESDSAASKPPPKIVVTVDKAGNYFVNKDSLDPSDVVSDLQNKLNQNPDAIVIVNVDKTQSTQTLISVMDDVNSVSAPGTNEAPAVMIASQAVDQSGNPVAVGGQ